MSEKRAIAKAGHLLQVDEGAYSNYSVIGFFVVLRDFDPMALLEEYKAAHPEQVEAYSFRSGMFLAFLLSNGLLLEIERGSLYLGLYSNCDGEDGVRFYPTLESDWRDCDS